MRDYKYKAILDFVFPCGDTGPRVEVDVPKTPELRPVRDALNENIVRVKGLALMPASIINASLRRTAIETYVEEELRSSLGPDVTPTKKQISEAKAQAAEDIKNGSIRLEMSSLEEFEHASPLHAAAENFETIAKASTSPVTPSAIGAFYASVMIGTYTAFESLSTDLWVAAVNLRPRSLAKNALDRTFKAHPRGQKDEDGVKSQEPSFKFSDLEVYDFSLVGKMGDFIRDKKRAAFESLTSVEVSYAQVFRNDAAPHRRCGVLERLFEKEFTCLKELEAIRNLLAHRGGIVDQRFADELKFVESPLVKLPKNKRIELDGEMVGKHAGSAVRFSISLLEYVDKWLVDHPA